MEKLYWINKNLIYRLGNQGIKVFEDLFFKGVIPFKIGQDYIELQNGIKLHPKDALQVNNSKMDVFEVWLNNVNAVVYCAVPILISDMETKENKKLCLKIFETLIHDLLYERARKQDPNIKSTDIKIQIDQLNYKLLYTTELLPRSKGNSKRLSNLKHLYKCFPCFRDAYTQKEMPFSKFKDCCDTIYDRVKRYIKGELTGTLGRVGAGTASLANQERSNELLESIAIKKGKNTPTGQIVDKFTDTQLKNIFLKIKKQNGTINDLLREIGIPNRVSYLDYRLKKLGLDLDSIKFVPKISTATRGDYTYRDSITANASSIMEKCQKIGLHTNHCIACNSKKKPIVAHYKAVCDFSEDTLVSTINAIDNLVPLCSNCHDTFDGRNMTPEDVKKRPKIIEKVNNYIAKIKEKMKKANITSSDDIVYSYKLKKYIVKPKKGEN